MAINTFSTSQSVTLGAAPRFARCTNNSGTVAMTLPAAASNAGLMIAVKRSGNGACTLATVDGGTLTLESPGNSGSQAIVVSDGANWYSVSIH